MWKWFGYTYENKSAVPIAVREELSSAKGVKPDAYKSIHSSSIRFHTGTPKNTEIYEKSTRK